MNEVLRYQLDSYELTVDNASYIVAVRENPVTTRTQNSSAELPKWVFQSKHAIWLADENASLYERASKGERIKEKLKHTAL